MNNTFLKDVNILYLGIRCSNYMSGIKKLFSNLAKTIKFDVKFGNNIAMPHILIDCAFFINYYFQASCQNLV